MNDLNLTGLAHEFTTQNFLPMARQVAYPKILAAMRLAAARVQQRSNERVAETLKQIQEDRLKGDMPK